MSAASLSTEQLEVENARLRAELEDARDTIEAIRSGRVDALVVERPGGDEVYVLSNADRPYRALVEDMQEGALALRPDGCVLFCNRQIAQMCQVASEVLLGNDFHCFLSPGCAPVLDALLSDGIQPIRRGEVEMTAANGTVLSVQLSARRMPVDGMDLISVIVTDLTHQKRFQEIMASQGLANSVIDQAVDAILICDAEGKVLRANAAAHQLCGVNPLFRPLSEVLPLRHANSPALFSRAGPFLPSRMIFAPDQEPFSGSPAVFDNPSGRHYSLRVSTSTLRNVEDDIHGFVVTVADVTERDRLLEDLWKDKTQLEAVFAQRERMQRDLDESHQRLQALMNALPVGVSFSSDATCEHITGNPAVMAQFEIGPQDNLSASAPDAAAPGRKLQFFQDGRPVNAVELPLQRAVAERRPVAPLEIEVELPSGRRWYAECSAAPIFDPRGSVIGGVAVTVDITEHKRAEESLRKLGELAERRAAEAQAGNDAKTQFLANISHELRTPMNAIQGMIELALRNDLPDDTRDCLDTARESAHLLLSLLNDLLDSAKIESGNLELEAAPLSLCRVLDQISRVLSVRASEKGLTFYTELPDDLPDAVVGDKVRLRQVLLNLAGNAIKFTERGEVAVIAKVASLTSEEAELEFSVRDTGIGIPPGDLDRIFKPFAQADASTTRRFGGTGLGLSISANLAALMGGRIWAESRPSQGSTFHFTVRLPLAAEPPVEEAAGLQIAAAPTAALRILLVEDNPANQKLASYILRQRGHTIDLASDGHQALRMTGEVEYDVILMDVQMPGMDGLATTAAIRARESHLTHVPIIAMTAHAMRGDRERCLARGMDGYLSKPIEAGEMIALVESLAPAAAASDPSDSVESAGAAPAAIFAYALALERCADSKEIFADMVQFFRNDVREVMPQISLAVAAGDLSQAARLGHRLKGTIIYLGAALAEKAATAIEQLGADDDPIYAKEAMQTLEQACSSLEKAWVTHFTN